MKRLDHNEAVKALREGKVVVAHSQYSNCEVKYRLIKMDEDVIEMFARDKWLSATGDAFIAAQYFTLEEPEEIGQKKFNTYYAKLDMEPLLQELDKRYVRK